MAAIGCQWSLPIRLGGSDETNCGVGGDQQPGDLTAGVISLPVQVDRPVFAFEVGEVGLDPAPRRQSFIRRAALPAS
ncbi:MAG: hypothetical protein WD156_08915, partial [Acidimicrobiia bacterium]